MSHRPPVIPRSNLRLELLESRLAPTATTLVIQLDPVADRFGNQIVTVQAYETNARAAFGIFDTGASALTFSAGDQARFLAQGTPIPIKIPGGAVAEGLGQPIVGDISAPGTILADGLHAANLSFDSFGHPQFAMQFMAGSAAVHGIQALVGTQTGSPLLPTITGMSILDGGLAALVQMQGATFDFSQVVSNLSLALPDLTFVSAGTPLKGSIDSLGPVRIPLTLEGFDNFVAPGNALSEARVPFQNDVGLVNQQYGSIKGQQFLFDTGAQVTLISTHIAQALGLDLQHAQFSTLLEGVGGGERIPGYVVDELDLPTSDGGHVQFRNVPVFVADLGQGFDGVLGMNLLNSAMTMLVDPFGAGGPSVSLAFPKLAAQLASNSADVLATLNRLGVSFAGAFHGSQVPGLTFNTGTISGQVFLDYNGNGQADAPEPGLAGQTVYLDLQNSGRLDAGDPTTMTDANGYYRFNQLAPGNYTVREVVASGFTTMAPPLAHVVVLPGSVANDVSIANVALQPNATTAFVAQLYGTLLDRSPEAAGLANWVQQVQQGVSRDVVARAIWDSSEHRAREVDGYYQTYLHRAADPVGRLSWVNAFQAGLSEQQVQQAFLTSAEYQALHPDNTAFLTGLYEELLGREPDAAGSASWQQALGTGLSRAATVQLFLSTDEFYRQTLNGYYTAFLHRSADAAGQANWLALLDHGKVTLEEAGQFFLGAPEFLAWTKQFSTAP